MFDWKDRPSAMTTTSDLTKTAAHLASVNHTCIGHAAAKFRRRLELLAYGTGKLASEGRCVSGCGCLGDRTELLLGCEAGDPNLSGGYLEASKAESWRSPAAC